MLFVQSKSLNGKFDAATRLAVLDHLAERNFQPLIRAVRQKAFDNLLPNEAERRELERLVLKHNEERGPLYEQYVRGDLFCFDDYALFLVFDDEGDEGEACVRVGIVYEQGMIEPQHKLDEFGRHVQVALIAAKSEEENGRQNQGASENGSLIHTIGLATWKPSNRARKKSDQARLAAFRLAGRTAAESSVSLLHLAKPNGDLAQIHLLLLMQEREARHLVQRLLEAQAEGRMVKRPANASEDATAERWIDELANAGLLRREVLVSCHREGRGLFRLPSLDALNALAASGACCNECGRPIADERAEEVIAPTPLAAQMLEENAWLDCYVREALKELNVNEANLLAQSNVDGIRCLLVEVYDELFLMLLREGDWTPSHAARALELCSEMNAAHLAVMTTDRVQAEARVLLQDAARRRARKDGEGFEIIFCEDLNSMAAALEPTFERVAQRAICNELCELDSSLGFSVGYMIATRFNLRRRPRTALEDFAASTAQEVSANLGAL